MCVSIEVIPISTSTSGIWKSHAGQYAKVREVDGEAREVFYSQNFKVLFLYLQQSDRFHRPFFAVIKEFIIL